MVIAKEGFLDITLRSGTKNKKILSDGFAKAEKMIAEAMIERQVLRTSLTFIVSLLLYPFTGHKDADNRLILMRINASRNYLN